MVLTIPRRVNRFQAMTFDAEIFDRMQWLYESTGFNDHQVHCELDFAAPLDEASLRRAVELSLDTIPILATKYVMDEGQARWRASRAPIASGPSPRPRTR